MLLLVQGFLKKAACHAVVADKARSHKINQFNRHFRTPKIKTFHRLIDKLNAHHSLNISKKPLDYSPLGSNAWLAGLTEADGYL